MQANPGEEVVVDLENVEPIWHQELLNDLPDTDPEDYNYRPSHVEVQVPQGIEIPVPQFYFQFANLLKGSFFF